MLGLRALGVAVAAAGMIIAGAASASAAEPIVLPSGIGCAFELRIDVSGGKQQYREFTDQNGNVVRTISAGRGTDLVFTNAENGKSISLRSNGSVSRTRVNPNGSTSTVATGHNVLILFPSDVPAGPTTTLYVGQVSWDVDSAGVFTLTGHAGQTTDICAAIA
jgi:hypothetical protein